MKYGHTAQFPWKTGTVRRLLFCVLVASVLYLTAAGPVRAQDSRVFTEWTVPTANSEPLLALPVSDDTVFFTERGAGKIGKLNLESNNISEWTLPQRTTFPDAEPHELIQVGNRIFVAEQRRSIAYTGAIGALNPATGQLTEWTISSTAFPVPEHLLQIGTVIYFTEATSDRIGALNPSTNAVREWLLPYGPTSTTSLNLNGLDSSADGENLWFVEILANRIARLNVVTNTLTEWTLPIPTNLLNHVYVQERFVYFPDFSGNSIFRLDPTTNTIKVWTDPSPGTPGVAGLSLTDLGGGLNEANEPVKVYFSGYSRNRIGSFITTEAPSTDYPVTPVITVLTPVDSAATAVTSTPPKTVTHETPVKTVVPGVLNLPFEFWPIPTANAGFGDFAKFEEGSLLFTERLGNKVALFSKSENGD